MAWFDDLELPGSTITGHFAFVHEDGPDEDDYPDVRLASGTVRFEATAKAVKAGGAWIGIAPVEARIFDGEIIVDEDDPNPPRILSTDADVGVEDWGWKAIFDIAGANIKPVTFKAPKEGVHLTSGDLIPVTGHPVEVIAGPPGTSVVGIRDNGDQTVTWLYSDGTESDPYEIGTGPRGVSGIASVTSPESGVWMIDQATDGDEDRLKDLQEAVYDKVARWELEAVEDASPKAAWHGSVTVEVTGGSGSATVDFPSDLFSDPPLVMLTKNSARAARHVPYVAGVTPTSARVGLYDPTSSSRTSESILCAVYAYLP